MLAADPYFILIYVGIMCFLLTIILGMAHVIVDQNNQLRNKEKEKKDE